MTNQLERRICASNGEMFVLRGHDIRIKGYGLKTAIVLSPATSPREVITLSKEDKVLFRGDTAVVQDILRWLQENLYGSNEIASPPYQALIAKHWKEEEDAS